MDLDKEELTRKRRGARKLLDPVKIVGKKRKRKLLVLKAAERVLEEDCNSVLFDDPTTATVSDPVTEASARYSVKQSVARQRVVNSTVLEECRLLTSSDILMLFDGSVGASLGAMRPLIKKLDMLLAPAQEYSSLRERIKDVLHLLKHDVEEISSYLDELTEVEDPPPMAKCWMNEARDLSYDMEDYINSLLFVPPDHSIKKKKKRKKKMVIKKRLKWCKQIVFTRQASEHGIKTSKIIHVNVPRLPSKPKVAKIILQFRIYVQEAIERHDKYRLHCCSTLRRRLLSTGSMLPVPIPYEEAAQIVTDGRMNEFINSLAANDTADQQELKVVSVLGSGCLGKTTLANVLYDRIGMQFECRAFIQVSKKPDMKRLFRDLFSQFHQKQPLPTSCNELGISDNIIKHLQDKRYLIVIDDLWDASVWDIIKYAFPKGNHGSKIIITTQIEDVALTCCCDHPEHVFEMKPLNVGHSRELFFNRLFGSESDYLEEFKQVSNEIVDICGGLPLATINIASHLANQETEVSMDLLTDTRDLLRSYLWSNSTSERTKQVLNLSYNNLPHYLKTCLLYLHMYPEGSIIWKDDLVKQLVAEGFIATRSGKDQDQEMIEKAAGLCFDALIDRRFIQPIYTNYNNKVLSCRVHEVVYDLIAQKSAEENFIVVVDHNRKNIALSHKVRRLSLNFGDSIYAKTPANITKSQIRSFRFFGLFECMPCIREFKVLRVLNLQLYGHRGDNDPIDLTGISELFQLRYLKITSDVCIKLPNQIRKLQCLETLDIMDAPRVTAVPWDIINLPHLLHLTLPVGTYLLDLIGSMTDSIISLWSLGKLNYLQDLHLTSSSTHPSYHLERSVEALGYLIGGHGNLKTIVVAHGSSAKNTLDRGAPEVTISWDRMAPPPLLQRFECPHSCFIFYRIPKWVTELGNLCILKIAVKELHMICVGTLRGLHALTDLSLYVETAPIDKIIFDKAGFSVLKYCKLRFAAGIAWLKFEADAMPSLWKLKLVFNAIPRMDQNLVFFYHDRPAILQSGAAVVSVEHMPGLRVISAKFGGAASDLEYASRTVVSNHPSNPTINMQLVCYGSNGDRSRKRKHQPNDVVKEQPDEYDKRLERPAEKRISAPTESSSRLHVPEITPKPMQITENSAQRREHMFDTVLTRGDVGMLNRLVVPKKHAEKYFPLDSSSTRNRKGTVLSFEDPAGKSWFFHYSYRNSSQNYVMFKGWSDFVKDKFLEAGDTVSFSRGVGEATRGRLFIDCQNEQTHMFERVLTASDVESEDCSMMVPGHLVGPHLTLHKVATGRHTVLKFEDGRGNGKVWPFQFQSSSQCYVMKGLNYFVNDRNLVAGDTVSFYRAGTRLFVDSGRHDDKAALGTKRRVRIYPSSVTLSH
uniref:NBS-LRR disease resistance protein n=1 Tax=Dasypyrum villosum TaxID=40247 RepID=A0A8K1MIW9_9POAL|nr:NBS-LRR disease resistance protein [Dasypyrum villosum]